MGSGSRLSVFIGLVIAAIIVGAVWMGRRGQRGDRMVAADVDRSVMAD